MMVLVSVPYEITLLSNVAVRVYIDPMVSVPYEITLLSNMKERKKTLPKVSVPYEITLLSNSSIIYFSGLEFQYLMKLHYSQTHFGANVNSTKFQYLMKLHYSQT